MEVVAGQVLTPEYRINLLILSYVIACLGSVMAIQCTRMMYRKDGTLDWPMTIGAAVALGGVGIWSMHFIGMLAYRVEVSVSYHVLPTVASLLAAILISGIALVLAGGRGRFSKAGWLAGSVLAGLGVAAMHYLGMYAMNMQATMTLDMQRVALSVGIAIAAAAAALWLAFHLNSLTHRLAAGLVMGLAVCSMHYTGMSAATLICTATPPEAAWVIRSTRLDLWVTITAVSVLAYLYWLVALRLVEGHFAASARA